MRLKELPELRDRVVLRHIFGEGNKKNYCCIEDFQEHCGLHSSYMEEAGNSQDSLKSRPPSPPELLGLKNGDQEAERRNVQIYP